MSTGIILGAFAGFFIMGVFTGVLAAAIMAAAGNSDRPRNEPQSTDIESSSRRTGAA